MARIKQGILGGFSGKVGPIVGSSWKGIAVMKSKPLSVANPRSSGQVEQRSRMAGIVILSQLFLAIIIKPLWDRFAQQMSGYNAFVRTNIGCFVAGVLTNYADLVISMGKMAKTVISSVTSANASANVIINWTDDSGSGFRTASDESFVYILNEQTGGFAIAGPSFNRSTGSLDISLSEPNVTGNTLHVWLAFRRTDGTIVSDTTYFTKTI